MTPAPPALPPSGLLLARLRRRFDRLGFQAMMAARALMAPVAFGAHGVLIAPDGRVLLVRHTYMRGLSFPGGGVGRGEAPEAALMRELTEEIGPFRAGAPHLIGLFSRRTGWATNVIALYRLTDAQVLNFRPNAEIREIVFADPGNPPADTTPGTARRLAEQAHKRSPDPYW